MMGPRKCDVTSAGNKVDSAGLRAVPRTRARCGNGVHERGNANEREKSKQTIEQEWNRILSVERPRRREKAAGRDMDNCESRRERIGLWSDSIRGER